MLELAIDLLPVRQRRGLLSEPLRNRGGEEDSVAPRKTW